MPSMTTERLLLLGVNDDGSLDLGGPWALQEVKGNASLGNGTTTSTPALIAGANTSRKALIIVNIGTDVIYLGVDGTVSTGTGFPIPPNGGYFMDNITRQAWWGICATTAEWRSLEV